MVKRENTRRRKRTRKRKVSQSGGFCAPCLMGPLFTAAGLGTTGYMMSSSSSSSNIPIFYHLYYYWLYDV